MSLENRALDVVTGAFSYSGSHIAQRLLDGGREVRTLTSHPDRDHPLRERVESQRYRFDDPAALAHSLSGVDTLYNTYWVRFNHGATSFGEAIENSRMLFAAARSAGVRKVVHVSISNPSIESRLPYFRGKAVVEDALALAGVPYAIVRPTVLFGGERDVLINNIAWILRRSPVFAVPGDGRYPVQPVHVDDLARLCIEAGESDDGLVIDAAGPELMSFSELVAAVRSAVGGHAPIMSLPPPVMAVAARMLGLVVSDVVLTRDEISGLMAGLLVSHDSPRGRIAFRAWIDEHGEALGRSYANELGRHFARARE